MAAKRCCLTCGGWDDQTELRQILGAGWVHQTDAGCTAYLEGMRSAVGQVRDLLAADRQQRELQAEREPELLEGWPWG
jgi:hypothetical protein